MDNYKVIEEKLKRHESFRGNTMWAMWDGAGTYLVFSYQTKIAEYNADDDDGRTLNPRQHSVTTSKHQSIIARAWGFPPLAKLRRLTAYPNTPVVSELRLGMKK